MPLSSSMMKGAPIAPDDERDISRLLIRYATAIDGRDWQLLRSCFTADCEAEYGKFGHWRGPREIAEYMEDVHRPFAATLHRITNIAVERRSGEVLARSYVDVLFSGSGPHESAPSAAGYYDDQLIRTADGWRIARRKFTLIDA